MLRNIRGTRSTPVAERADVWPGFPLNFPAGSGAPCDFFWNFHHLIVKIFWG